MWWCDVPVAGTGPQMGECEGLMALTEEQRQVLAVFYELLDAQEAGNVGRMRATLSDRPEAVHMLTDGMRWETSSEAANAVTAVPPGLRLVADHFDVHLQGSVAWVEGMGRIINPGGDSRLVRMSGVLVREHGRWVIVQSHASLPVRDADIFKLARFN
jgi:SnoaL-like domain